MKFIGIGLGPGDSELITVKAVKWIKKLDVVITAASEKTRQSYALKIARDHIDPDAEIIKAYFPMTGKVEETQKVYDGYVNLIKEKIDEGKIVGFLCLGDPLLYSTYGRLIHIMKKKYPSIPIETIPGIPAFCAAAARANRVLAKEDEILSIVPASRINGIEPTAKCSDRMILMKVYKQKYELIDRLAQMGYVDDVLYIEKTGLPGEYWTTDIETIRKKKDNYLSLLFVNRR